MKAIVLSLAMLISTVPAFAARVKGASIDATGKYLLVDVVHGGGCGTHDYSLELGGCLESYPVQCSAKLVHKSNDMCEAMISATAKISLADAGLTGDYFSNGSLTITGDKDYETGKASSASLRLPSDLPAAPATGGSSTNSNTVNSGSGGSDVVGGADIVCITNAGSRLQVSPSTKIAKIEATSGETANISITRVSTNILESYPSIEVSTYSLDDGRSIVISFTGNSRVGTGNYIRVNGERSPGFQSCIR